MQPKTLQAAIKYFSDEQTCIDTVAKLRWPNGVECPACGHKDHYWLASQKRWKCKECYKQFSVKLGTIFEESAVSLGKWLVALWMLVNCKNGVSSYEVSKAIGVTQKSAWFMLHRLRLALQMFGGKLGGEVEADETFIGGKARNMHQSVKERRGILPGRHGESKTMVLGMVERGGHVRTEVIADRLAETLREKMNKHVAAGAALYTDAYHAYRPLSDEYRHQVIDHAEKYVDGRVHTNGIENFWSLVKRQLNGTYISVEPFHLFRYLDEQAFRYNNRARKDQKITDADRFSLALSQVAGKRLTFTEVTGKN